jgi:hypothetical protein
MQSHKGPCKDILLCNNDVLNGALEEKTYNRSLGCVSTFTTFCCIWSGITWTPITEIEGITFGSFGSMGEVQENLPDMMYIVTYHVANMTQSRTLLP